MNLNLWIWFCHQNQGLLHHQCHWFYKSLNHTGIYVLLFITLLIIFGIWLSFLAHEIKLGFGSFLPGHLHTGPEIKECQIGKFRIWNFSLQVFGKKYGCAMFWFNRGNYWSQFWVVQSWWPGHPRIVLKHPCSLAYCASSWMICCLKIDFFCQETRKWKGQCFVFINTRSSKMYARQCKL